MALARGPLGLRVEVACSSWLRSPFCDAFVFLGVYTRAFFSDQTAALDGKVTDTLRRRRREEARGRAWTSHPIPLLLQAGGVGGGVCVLHVGILNKAHLMKSIDPLRSHRQKPSSQVPLPFPGRN